MIVVSVCSLKGGVGKTSIVLGLASSALTRGVPTLVVDLDPQADATLAQLGGRADLLCRLGTLVASKGEVFGRHDTPRPGGLFDRLANLSEYDVGS